MTLSVRSQVAAAVLLFTTLFDADAAHASAAHRGFNLFVPAANVLLRGNRVHCNINNLGEVCVDPNNNPSLGGGFWPRGTADQYIYNGGINFAALILGSPTPGFPWPGDTVGAWFFDQRGDQQHSEPLTPVADGLSAHDWLRWPSAGRATDPAIFAPALLGRHTVSDQDSWTRYWDGGTGQNSGRKHPAGVMVDQRTMSFDTPGLEDVVFVIHRLVNVTARDPAAYQQLAAVGYSSDDIAAIAALGATFQDRMERKYQIQIPDGGYPLDSLYVSYEEDSDVGSAGSNYSNLNLVFASGFAWKSDFREPTWQYPPDIFAPPFAQAPGFVANAYLRTPPSLFPGAPRIWFSGNFSGAAPFPATVGVSRLWRRSSGNLLPNDGTCSVPSPKLRHFCALFQVPADTRYFMSTGPSRLGPGESIVLISAHVFAPAIESAILPFVGTTPGLVGGLPVDGARLVNGLDTLRVVDRAAGWVSHSDINGNGAIEPNEVLTTPRSLLARIQAAQAALDRGFVMPAAPEAPEFFVLPGDGRATVVWQPSATETTGDGYFQVAADPTSALYDPDYRRTDVEGYRVWRGTAPDNMRVIAQFDYSGTAFSDYTGQVVNNSSSSCAPELGVTAGCPAFPAVYGLPSGFSIYPSALIQVRLGDRVRLSNGAVALLRTDTAVTGGASGRQALRDTGVPFVFIDSAARNGETWLYSVTAFDVNSVRSGPSTLESPPAVKSVMPRTTSSNTTLAAVVLEMMGDDSVALDPTLPFPAIDSLKGTFFGPIPPANAGMLTLLNPVAELLSAGDYIVRIDSSRPGFVSGIGQAPRLYLTASGASAPLQLTMDISPPSFNAAGSFVTAVQQSFPLIPYDSAAAARFGMPPELSAQGTVTAAFADTVTGLAAHSGTVALSQGRYGVADQASRYLSHSRWFDEGGVEPPDPTIDFNYSPDHNSGKLTGVSAIWAPMPYRGPMTAGGLTQYNANFRGFAYGRPLWYPADFVVTWGSGGAVVVRDATHHVNLPAVRGLQMGYGFLNVSALQAAGVTNANLADGLGSPQVTVPSYHALYALDPVCLTDWWSIPCAALSPVPELEPFDYNNDGVADATGIILSINGEVFFMAMGALPAPGTKWHLRAVGGQGMSATCSSSLPPNRLTELLVPPSDCAGYRFVPGANARSALAPGLRFRVRVVGAYDVSTTSSGTLAAVHTVPDPYYFTNSLEAGAGRQILRFVNLPDRAIIRIYTAGGALAAIVNHNDASGGGEEAWDLITRGGRAAASGVYFFHVEAADGQTRVGRFVVVNGY